MNLAHLADFKVGDRTVRPSLGVIVNGDQSVRVEPRSIDVLVALAERSGQVYPKKELIEAVWGDTYVTDEVLTHAIWDLRKAFGDNASRPKFIQTIPKRGYRIIAPVEAVEPEEAASEGVPASPDRVARESRLLRWGLVVVLLFVLLVGIFSSSKPVDPVRPERSSLGSNSAR